MQKGLFLILFLVFFSACNQNQIEIPSYPVQQQVFTESLNCFCHQRENTWNKSNKKEIFSAYETWINSFSDSIVFVNNWKGKIKNIQLHDAPAFKSTSIGFDIEFPLRERKNLAIHFEKHIPYGKENENLIFQQIQLLEERATVTFDGIFKTDENRKLKFGGQYGIYDRESKNLCEPHLEMAITSVKPDTISDSANLREAKRLLSQEWKKNREGLDNNYLSPEVKSQLRGQFEAGNKEILQKDLSFLEAEELRYLASVINDKEN